MNRIGIRSERLSLRPKGRGRGLLLFLASASFVVALGCEPAGDGEATSARDDVLASEEQQKDSALHTRSVVQELVEQLTADENEVRKEAARRLMESHLDLIVPIVTELNEKDFDDRQTATSAIVNHIIDLKWHSERDHSIEPDAEFGRGNARIAIEALLPNLIEEVKLEPDDLTRGMSACWLPALAGDIDLDLVVDTLIGALKDESRYVRAKTLGALGRLGPKAKEAVFPLVELMQTEDPMNDRWGLRNQACMTLSQIGPAARAAGPALAEAVAGKHSFDGAGSAYALTRIDPDAQIVVPVLVDALTSDDVSVRHRACYVLGSLGAAAEPAVPRLVELLEDESENVRKWARHALEKIQPEKPMCNDGGDGADLENGDGADLAP